MINYIFIAILFIAALSPLISVVRNKSGRKTFKRALAQNIICFLGMILLIGATAFGNTAAAASEAAAGASTGDGLGFIGAALVTGMSCLGAGVAVAGAASAALGAISENEKLFGKAFVMVVLAEGIAIYGLVISVMILNKI